MDIIYSDTPDGWLGLLPDLRLSVKVTYAFQEQRRWNDVKVKEQIMLRLTELMNKGVSYAMVTLDVYV